MHSYERICIFERVPVEVGTQWLYRPWLIEVLSAADSDGDDEQDVEGGIHSRVGARVSRDQVT
jgi:hypothetical protein